MIKFQLINVSNRQLEINKTNKMRISIFQTQEARVLDFPKST